MQIEDQIKQGEKALGDVTEEFAVYYSGRATKRASLKEDRQDDLNIKIKVLKKELAIERDAKISQARALAAEGAKSAIASLRANEAVERRKVFKDWDAKTNSEMGKMKTRMTRLIVELGRLRSDQENGQQTIPEAALAAAEAEF